MQNELELNITTEIDPQDVQERDRIREEYRARLAEKLKDPEFRKIEGFPIGTDEAILALSDPPYYTACPNPFIEEWLAENAKPYNPATDDYHREPFAADVSEGRQNWIYKAHTFHTKVPHKAIMRYILHYTQPGDVVYDGFCGTGMTGVAAHLCGDKAQVESLGYIVSPDGNVSDAEDIPFTVLGERKSILCDIAPAATFISENYNLLPQVIVFQKHAADMLAALLKQTDWMYLTLVDATEAESKEAADALSSCSNLNEVREFCISLRAGKWKPTTNRRLITGVVNYIIWSEAFLCPMCDSRFAFYDVAMVNRKSEVLDVFICPKCRAELKKRDCEVVHIAKYDYATRQPISQTKWIPVLVNFSTGKKRMDKRAGVFDAALAEAIEKYPVEYPFPVRLMMEKGEQWGDTWRAGHHKGITHVHHFFMNRNLATIAFAKQISNDNFVWWLIQSVLYKLTKLMCLNSDGFGRTQKGTLYISSVIQEMNPNYLTPIALKDIVRATHEGLSSSTSIISTCSSAAKISASNSVDYVFTDPPFGANIAYSELNFIWESWLGVVTNTQNEAITNDAQSKTLEQYQNLMAECFKEAYRILKPGRWMTVEFHNSANSVWNAIQEALERVGFVVADVRMLDKKQGAFNQVVAAGSTKVDLVISCYKPRHEFEERFKQIQGKPEGVVEFLREHLSMLPVAPINKAGRLETIAERTRFLLFDRMVAYHLQRGARIPLSSAPFYQLLEEQFVERDEMYFLPEQAARFDAVRARGVETEQLSIFVRDEKTAVQWVRSRLTEQPQTLGDLTPKFMQELREWESHEPRPELRDLLKEYFVEESSVWHVPDPNSEKDIESMRRNALLRLFREYTNTKGPLKVFRKEAILEGFRHCWDTQQYGVIVAVCEKIPEKILQEIQDFVMMYDVAKDLAPTMEPQTAFVWE